MSDLITDAPPVTYPVQSKPCPDCSQPDNPHYHAGEELGFICVGCPCDRRPAPSEIVMVMRQADSLPTKITEFNVMIEDENGSTPVWHRGKPLTVSYRTGVGLLEHAISSAKFALEEQGLSYDRVRVEETASSGQPNQRGPLQPLHDHTADEPCGAGCPFSDTPNLLGRTLDELARSRHVTEADVRRDLGLDVDASALDTDAQNRLVGMLVATGELEVVGFDVAPPAPDGRQDVTIALDPTSEITRARAQREVSLRLGAMTFELGAGAASNAHSVPPDWYDGKPKPCPGQAMVRFSGECAADGERTYICRCSHCDKPFPPGLPTGPHTFIPVRPEDYTFKTGKYFYGIEAEEMKPRQQPPSSMLYGVAPGPLPWPSGQVAGDPTARIRAMAEDSMAKMASSRSLHRRPPRRGDLAPTDDDIAMADLHNAAELGCHCSGFVCTQHLAVDQLAAKRPAVVVVLGEPDWVTLHNKLLTEALDGRITLTPVVPGGEQPEIQRHLVALMKRQLDMADEVLVLNVGGHVTEFAAQAVEYAELCGIPIRWLETPK
jgi:hypothetical protein